MSLSSLAKFGLVRVARMIHDSRKAELSKSPFSSAAASRTRRLAGLLVAAIVMQIFWMPRPIAAAPEGQLSSRGFQLLMIEEPGCAYCARWMNEVAPGYRKSSEGRLAPLVIRDRFDAEVKSFGRVVYTPTFILLRDGVERGRILGYPGADFFWSMLGEMLRRETKSEVGVGAAPSAPLGP